MEIEDGSPDNALEVYREFESARLDDMDTKSLVAEHMKVCIGTKMYRSTKLH